MSSLSGCEILNAAYSPSNTVLSIVPLEVFVRLFIVLPEFSHNVLAHVTVILLDLPSCLHLVLWGNLCHLPSLSHKIQHKLCDIPSSDWNMLDRTTNNVALSNRNDVSDPITRVDNGTSERAVSDTV